MANLLPPVPTRSQVVDKAGVMTQVMVSFLNGVRKALGEPDGPPSLTFYAKASVPGAAANPGKMIWVTDAADGAGPYISDGTDWLRLPPGAVLS